MHVHTNIITRECFSTYGKLRENHQTYKLNNYKEIRRIYFEEILNHNNKLKNGKMAQTYLDFFLNLLSRERKLGYNGLKEVQTTSLWIYTTTAFRGCHDRAGNFDFD